MDVHFDEDPARWDAFVAASPQRSVFVTSAFLRSLGTPFELVTCRVDGRIVAGSPVMLADDGRPLPSVHPFTMYQGLLYADPGGARPHRRVPNELAACQAFVDALMARHGRCCISLSWRHRDVRGFLWHNYHEHDAPRFSVDVNHAGVLDLTPYDDFDAYLASVRELRRREIKRGAREATITRSDDVDVLDRLHGQTFARQGIERSPHEVALLRAITGAALAGGFGEIWLASIKGEPASATLFLFDDRTAFYLFGANAPEHRNTGASTTLMVHMIRSAYDRGLREVDFVGANSPARGDYKVSFNADVHPYYVLRCGA